jgi:2-deoxy-D-gluconate 3-dehydrogenase
MTKAFDLGGRVAIVTGGNGGIGLGMATGLAQAGAALVIAGRNARTPAGRWGDPEDFAGIAVFLASGAADFVTRAAIPVDGGYSSQG